MASISVKRSVNNRIYGFDYLRVICAIFVVAIHSFDTNISLSNFISYFKFPVPVFLMISFFLLFRKVYFGTNNITFYLKQRCRRLVPCFFLWTLIYLFVRILAQSNLSWSWDSIAGYLFCGSAAVQLYYLPLTIYYCIILLPVIVMCKSQNIFYNTLGLGIIMTIAITIQKSSLTHLHKSFFSDNIIIFLQYAKSNFIYAFFGLYLAYLTIYSQQYKPKLISLKLLPLIIFTTITVIDFWNNANFQQLEILINILIFALFYYVPLSEHQVVSCLAKISLGIYLTHHLFIELFQEIEQIVGYDTNNFYLTMINFLSGTIISIIFSVCLSKIEYVKFLVA